MIDLEGVKLVIFDCDGVLVDTEPLANQVLAGHASSMGWDMDGPTSQKIFQGMTMTQVHQRIETHMGQKLDDSWINQYYQNCFEMFKSELRPVPGAPELVARVAASGRKLCVASQGPHEKMNLTLGVTDLLGYFEGHIFSAQDVARPKPYPDLFLHAAKCMNTAPEHCCVIEDSQTGVTAARSAGMQVIHLTPITPENETSGQISRIFHLDEVLTSG